jgi:hypothetical protein
VRENKGGLLPCKNQHISTLKKQDPLLPFLTALQLGMHNYSQLLISHDVVDKHVAGRTAIQVVTGKARWA